MDKRKKSFLPKKRKIDKPLSTWQRLKKFLTSIYGIIAIVATLAGIAMFIDWVIDKSESNHDRFINESYIQGIFVPPYLKNQDLVFVLGGNIAVSHSYKTLERGETIIWQNATGIAVNQDFPFNLRLRIKDNLMYLSAEFKYLETNELIGSIKNNRWVLKKDQMIDYYSSSEAFEIRDKQNDVVFNMKINQDTVFINGYYGFTNGVFVLSNGGVRIFNKVKVDYDYIADGRNEIRKIEHLFPGVL